MNNPFNLVKSCLSNDTFIFLTKEGYKLSKDSEIIFCNIINL